MNNAWVTQINYLKKSTGDANSQNINCSGDKIKQLTSILVFNTQSYLLKIAICWF